jgi:hypothetical protein
MKLKPEEQSRRMHVADEVLRIFAEKTWLTFSHGYITVNWRQSSGKLLERRWMTRGQDFYPVWHRHWGHGGTALTALSQLVRWIQGKPVLPLATWRYWASPTVNLGRDGGPRMAELLAAGDYPEIAECVLCGGDLTGRLDWWSLKGITGPCCHHTEGCKQKPVEQKPDSFLSKWERVIQST